VDALLFLGFSEANAKLMASSPKKFLWRDLLKFFRGKIDQTISDCVKVLDKMEILKDPGEFMNDLIDCFAQRSLIVKYLT